MECWPFKLVSGNSPGVLFVFYRVIACLFLEKNTLQLSQLFQSKPKAEVQVPPAPHLYPAGQQCFISSQHSAFREREITQA